MGEKPGVLMVSKPAVPPWTDSGKNLMRDIVSAGRRYGYHVMGTAGAEPLGPACTVEPIYSTEGLYSAGLKQNRAVFRRLFKPDRLPLYHFFFAPNRITSMAARFVLTFKRRRTVHTICSVPRSYEGLDKLLFADRLVVLSQHTREQFESHTNRPAVHIPPCVPVGEPLPRERRERVRRELGLPDGLLVLYAGDYQFSTAADLVAKALPAICERTAAHFVFACRIKQEESRQREAHIKARVKEAGLTERVSFFNEVEDMEALAAAVDLSVLPADSLYAKMDIPLVLLESLREGVPVVVSTYGPLAELLARDVGAAVPTGESGPFAEAVVGLLENPEERRRMGANGKELVRSVYSPDRIGRLYEELYDSLLSSPENRETA